MQTRLFIDGRFVDADAGTTIDVYNPHDGSLIAAVAEARESDVDKAVAAAQRAFPAWRSTSAAERGKLLLALAQRMEEVTEELAQLESLDTGHPIRDTRFLDVPRTIANFRYFGGLADKYQGSVIPVEAGFLNYVQREPVGVVGQIVPWNFPLMFCSWKLGPALAAGNCVVLKPSELVPLTTLRLAELMAEVGFPEGVVNIVPGYGKTAGQRLAEHPDIRKIAFTGSTDVGRGIVQASAGNLKRVQLELGGKGPNIVFSDANLNAAVGGSAFAIFHNQGQACIAGSRLILQEDIADEFTEKFVALAKSIVIGNPASPETEMGPLTSRTHQQRVLDYCRLATAEDAEILLGGSVPDVPGLEKGYYVQPTIIRAAADSRLCREEVFGPFVTITTFKDQDDAIRIANGTEYGLGSGVWTSDVNRAHQVANTLHAGMVWINCYKRVNPGSPFGGVGASGYGRDMGFEAMSEYTEAKSVWLNVDAQIPPFYSR